MRSWLRRRRLRRSLLRDEAAAMRLTEIVRSYGGVLPRREGCHHLAYDDVGEPGGVDTVGEAGRTLPWVDPKPLPTPAARARADNTRRRTER